MLAIKITAPRKYSCGYIEVDPNIKKKKNYKETVWSIIVNDEISFSSAGTCDCGR